MTSEPLTESYFYILLCLYRGPNHGYGIMQEAAVLSQGRVKIGSGTMYGATSNLLKKNWIQEEKSDTGQDRRRMYRLTNEGRQALMSEVDRLKNLLDSAWDVMGGKKI